jgi:hypothetical protein
VLAVTHTLGAGTDAFAAWLRAGLMVLSAPLVYLVVLRVLPPPGRHSATVRPRSDPGGCRARRERAALDVTTTRGAP